MEFVRGLRLAEADGADAPGEVAQLHNVDWLFVFSGAAHTYLALKDQPDALRWLQLAQQDGTMSAFERNTEPLLAALKDEPALVQIQGENSRK